MPIPAMVGAAAIAGGTSLFGNALNAYSQHTANKQNIDYQREANALAWQQSVDMWNRTNMYNTPLAQLRRLEAAGLNPNLLYGNGTAATGNAMESSAPGVNAPHVNPVKYGDFGLSIADAISQYQNWRLNNLNADNIKAQTQNTQAKTISEGVHAALMRSQTLSTDYSRNFEKSTEQIRKAMLSSGLYGTRLENNIKRLNIRNLNFQNSVNELTKSSVIDAIKTDAIQKRMNLDTIKLQWKEMQERIKHVGIESKLGQQQYDYLNSLYPYGLSPSDTWQRKTAQWQKVYGKTWFGRNVTGGVGSILADIKDFLSLFGK